MLFIGHGDDVFIHLEDVVLHLGIYIILLRNVVFSAPLKKIEFVLWKTVFLPLSS